MAIATCIGAVFLPLWPENKEVKVSKITPQMVKILSRFSAATENAVRTALFPGADDTDGDGGLGGHPTNDDGDEADVTEALNHLIDHNSDEPQAALDHVRKAHAALTRIVERHGSAAPHSVSFARA
jgi:hypothetical protein